VGCTDNLSCAWIGLLSVFYQASRLGGVGELGDSEQTHGKSKRNADLNECHGFFFSVDLPAVNRARLS
jgi:hypothetical protein